MSTDSLLDHKVRNKSVSHRMYARKVFAIDGRYVFCGSYQQRFSSILMENRSVSADSSRRYELDDAIIKPSNLRKDLSKQCLIVPLTIAPCQRLH